MNRLVLLACFFMLLSCKGPVGNNPVFLDVHGLPRKNILVSEFAKEIDFIELGDSTTPFFDYLSNFKANAENYFFIANKGTTLFSFSKQGRFNYKINSIGRGPNEYTNITDYALMSDGGIIIYDLNLRKFLKYDKNGNHTKSISSAWFFREIESAADGIIGYEPAGLNEIGTITHPAGLIKLNKDFGYETNILSLENPTYPTIKNSLFFENDQIYFSPFWETEIFQVDHNKLNSIIAFNYGNERILKESLMDGSLTIKDIKELNTPYFIYNFLLCKDWILIKQGISSSSYIAILNNRKAFSFGEAIFNDIVGPNILEPIGVDNECMIFQDNGNPILSFDVWESLYRRNHNTKPDSSLIKKYNKIKHLAGTIPTNLLVKIKLK